MMHTPSIYTVRSPKMEYLGSKEFLPEEEEEEEEVLVQEDDKVRVGVRIRPMIESERAIGTQISWNWGPNAVASRKFDWDALSAEELARIPDDRLISFDFERVFGPEHTNEVVYKELVYGLVKRVVEGYNATFLAYGQTTSGKTHTITGDGGEENGILQLALKDLFHFVEENGGSFGSQYRFNVRVSYCEIYQESIRDLLDTQRKNLVIIDDPLWGPSVKDISYHEVHSAEQVFDLLEQGLKSRHVGRTEMTSQSSRSHTIFQVRVETKPKIVYDQFQDIFDQEEDDMENNVNSVNIQNNSNRNGKKMVNGNEQDFARNAQNALKAWADDAHKPLAVSSLNIIDLAGSERVSKTKARGTRLREAGQINKSLSALGNVISAINENSSYVPFRSSKLTRLLTAALGGNSLTSMICCMSPVLLHHDESRSTLQFAQRARKVKTHAKLNQLETGDAILATFKAQVTQLQQQLALNMNQKQDLQDRVRQLESRLSRSLANSFKTPKFPREKRRLNPNNQSAILYRMNRPVLGDMSGDGDDGRSGLETPGRDNDLFEPITPGLLVPRVKHAASTTRKQAPSNQKKSIKFADTFLPPLVPTDPSVSSPPRSPASNSEMEELKKQLFAKEAKLGVAKSHLRSAQVKLYDFLVETSNDKARLAKVTRQKQLCYEHFRQEEQTLRVELHRKTFENQNLVSKVSRMEQDKLSFERQLSALETKFQQLTKNKNEVNAKCEQLKVENDTFQIGNAKLQSELEDASKQLRESESRRVLLKKELEGCIRDLRKAELDMEHFQQSEKKLTSHAEALQVDLSSVSKERDEFKRQLVAMKSLEDSKRECEAFQEKLEKDFQKLRTEQNNNNVLSRKLKDQEARNRELVQEVDELKQRVAERDAELSKLKASKEKAETRLKNELEQVMRQTDEQQRLLMKEKGLREQLEDVIGMEKAQNRSLLENQISMDEKLSELSQDKARMSAALEDLRAGKSQLESQVKDMIQSENSRLTRGEQELKATKEKLDQSHETIKQLQAEVEKMHMENALLEGSKMDLEDRKKQLESQIETIQNHLETTRDESKQLLDESHRIQAERTKLLEEKETLETERNENNARIEDLKRKVTALENENKLLSETKQDMEQTIEGLRKDVVALEESKGQLEDALTKSNESKMTEFTKLQAIQKERMHKLEERLDEKNHQLMETKEQLMTKHKELERLVLELEETKKALDQRAEECQTLQEIEQQHQNINGGIQKELDRERGVKNELEKQIKQLSKEKAELSSYFQDLQGELQKQLETNETLKQNLHETHESTNVILEEKQSLEKELENVANELAVNLERFTTAKQVLEQELERVVNEKQSLETDLEDLIKDCAHAKAAMETEKKDLEMEHKTLKQSLESIGTEKQTLEMEHEALKQAHAILEEKITQGQKQLESQEVTKLRMENRELLQRLKGLNMKHWSRMGQMRRMDLKSAFGKLAINAKTKMLMQEAMEQLCKRQMIDRDMKELEIRFEQLNEERGEAMNKVKMGEEQIACYRKSLEHRSSAFNEAVVVARKLETELQKSVQKQVSLEQAVGQLEGQMNELCKTASTNSFEQTLQFLRDVTDTQNRLEQQIRMKNMESDKLRTEMQGFQIAKKELEQKIGELEKQLDQARRFNKKQVRFLADSPATASSWGSPIVLGGKRNVDDDANDTLIYASTPQSQRNANNTNNSTSILEELHRSSVEQIETLKKMNKEMEIAYLEKEKQLTILLCLFEETESDFRVVLDVLERYGLSNEAYCRKLTRVKLNMEKLLIWSTTRRNRRKLIK